jgi:hypothetical protein
MSRSAARFRQADIRRAVAGAAEAGLEVARIEILADGTIRLVPASALPHDSGSAFDKWQEKRDAARSKG